MYKLLRGLSGKILTIGSDRFDINDSTTDKYKAAESKWVDKNCSATEKIFDWQGCRNKFWNYIHDPDNFSGGTTPDEIDVVIKEDAPVKKKYSPKVAAPPLTEAGSVTPAQNPVSTTTYILIAGIVVAGFIIGKDFIKIKKR